MAWDRFADELNSQAEGSILGHGVHHDAVALPASMFDTNRRTQRNGFRAFDLDAAFTCVFDPHAQVRASQSDYFKIGRLIERHSIMTPSLVPHEANSVVEASRDIPAAVLHDSLYGHAFGRREQNGRANDEVTRRVEACAMLGLIRQVDQLGLAAFGLIKPFEKSSAAGGLSWLDAVIGMSRLPVLGRGGIATPSQQTVEGGLEQRGHTLASYRRLRRAS